MQAPTSSEQSLGEVAKERAPEESRQDAALSSAPNAATSSARNATNAFTTLMSSASGRSPEAPSKALSKAPPLPASGIFNKYSGRHALGAYINSPSEFPSEVIYANSDFVVVRDAFPKASLHLLLLPRNTQKSNTHPLLAFDDALFLATVREELKPVKKLAASELRRRYGKDSKTEAPRIKAMEEGVQASELPLGRDWEGDIRCGVHAGPSMHHLHIHVISVDCYSTKLKHRRHYNSFNTPFFVQMDEFPLATQDARRPASHGGFLRKDLICWRCHRNFKSDFAQLKLHLAEEYKEWKHL